MYVKHKKLKTAWCVGGYASNALLSKIKSTIWAFSTYIPPMLFHPKSMVEPLSAIVHLNNMVSIFIYALFTFYTVHDIAFHYNH